MWCDASVCRPHRANAVPATGVLNHEEQLRKNCSGDTRADAGEQDRHPEMRARGLRSVGGMLGQVNWWSDCAVMDDFRQSLPSRLRKSLPSFQIMMR